MAKRLTESEDRLIVLDFMGDPAPEGWAESCTVVTTWDELFEQIARPRFRVAVQIDEDPLEVLDFIAEIVQTESEPGVPEVGPVMVVIEEISECFETSRVKLSKNIQRMVRKGRRQWISTLLISQVYVDCPALFRRHLTALYLFNSNEKLDLDRHRNTYGVSVAEELIKLPKYSYCHFDVSRGTPGIVVDRHGRRRTIGGPPGGLIGVGPTKEVRTSHGTVDEIRDRGGDRAGDGQADRLQPDAPTGGDGEVNE